MIDDATIRRVAEERGIRFGLIRGTEIPINGYASGIASFARAIEQLARQEQREEILDGMNDLHTHRKRPHHATCVQWNGANTDLVLATLDDAHPYGDEFIIVRHERGISALRVRWWVVQGENGQVKCYVKYESLCDTTAVA